MLKEFKEFAFKGNMIDMAVGIILGGAFGLAIKSLVDNVMMPLVSGVLRAPDFSQLFFALDGRNYRSLAEAERLAAPVVKYGVFINDFINLMIIAFSLFIMVRYVVNAIKKREEEKPPVPKEPSEEVKLLTEIRDHLARKE